MELSATATSDVVSHWEGKAVKADAVARHLLDLRQAASNEEGYPLTRASVMNLLVYVDHHDQLEHAVKTVDDMAMRHPSRAIVVAPERGSRFSLDAEVVLHRHPLAQHGLVFERALLRPKGASPEGLDTLVIPLLIPHLQSYLWWLGDPDPADPALRSLLAICDRLVVDTRLGPADRLGMLSATLTGPQAARREQAFPRLVLGDMAWARLESFREVMARVFDHGKRAEFLDDIESMEIIGDRPRREGPSTAELLFAGWMASRLGYSRPMASVDGVSLQLDTRGGRTLFQFFGVARAPRSAAALQGFRLVAGGPRKRLSVELTTGRGEGRLVVVENGTSVATTVPMWLPSETQALSRELARIGRDRVYEDALLSAGRIESVVRGD